MVGGEIETYIQYGGEEKLRKGDTGDKAVKGRNNKPSGERNHPGGGKDGVYKTD